ncbi:high mobility group protein B3b [Salminus brasiliensis]|uniref:high mobility group protein B3b n=1 Tax=Salminus brasiliensis TaxID=930266 RepID=UPI003B8387B7
MAKSDVGKPKGKMSAYAYFVKTCREEHNKKNPGVSVNFAEFSKKCSERWKVMSPKEKTKFEDMAKQDKARYDQEMMSYNPGKRGRKKKDPNAPRRPPSGFLLFCAERRPSIKAQNPGMGIGDIAKKLGEMWNNMSDSEKQPFLSEANKLKDKYQKEVANYKRKGKTGSGASASKSKSKDDEDDDDEEEDDDEEDEEEDD